MLNFIIGMHLEEKNSIGLAKKFVKFFPYDGSTSAWLSLISFKTILLDYIVAAVISKYILKTYQNW